MKELTAEWVAIETIKLWDKNPRDNEKAVLDVAQSIMDFGFLVPIVVGKDMVVKAGNTRLKAAIKLNLPKVPIIKAEHLSEKQLIAFALAENKTSELATWKLGEIPNLISLADLPTIPGFQKADVDKIASFLASESKAPSPPEMKQGGIKTLITCPHCNQQFEGKAIKKSSEA